MAAGYEGNSREKVFRVTNISRRVVGLICVITAGVALAGAGLLYWRTVSTTKTEDPYERLPFRPAVTYHSSQLTISNTEDEPYLNMSLHIFIGSTRYETQIGTVNPGESVTRSLSSLTDQRGESFIPGANQTSELEVRARFRGYDVHKDFPPPP